MLEGEGNDREGAYLGVVLEVERKEIRCYDCAMFVEPVVWELFLCHGRVAFYEELGIGFWFGHDEEWVGVEGGEKNDGLNEGMQGEETLFLYKPSWAVDESGLGVALDGRANL
jgi:hypothetical protein